MLVPILPRSLSLSISFLLSTFTSPGWQQCWPGCRKLPVALSNYLSLMLHRPDLWHLTCPITVCTSGVHPLYTPPVTVHGTVSHQPPNILPVSSNQALDQVTSVSPKKIFEHRPCVIVVISVLTQPHR